MEIDAHFVLPTVPRAYTAPWDKRLVANIEALFDDQRAIALAGAHE